MSIWLEIHCDIGSSGPPGRVATSGYCYTHNTNNPGELCGNKREDFVSTLRAMHQEAREAGWLFKGGKWHCPNCRKMLLQQETEK